MDGSYIHFQQSKIPVLYPFGTLVKYFTLYEVPLISDWDENQ